jgi:hypothetical protein
MATRKFCTVACTVYSAEVIERIREREGGGVTVQAAKSRSLVEAPRDDNSVGIGESKNLGYR